MRIITVGAVQMKDGCMLADRQIAQQSSAWSPRSRAIWALVILGPPALFLALTTGIAPDVEWAGTTFHFYIVTITSLLAIVMAGFMVIAARQVHDTRVYFLGLAYLSIAGIFFVHALTTPGILVGMNPWIGFSARLSLLAGGIFLALAAFDWTPRNQRWILDHQPDILRALIFGLVSYLALALVASAVLKTDNLDHLAQTDVLWSTSLLTIFILTYSVVRGAIQYRQRRTPVNATMVASTIFLLQSQISMAAAPTWHASWWLYHALMLLAFIVILGGLATQYRSRPSLQGIFEGLLLRETVERFESEYTEALVALIAAVEARDPYTRGHSEQVGRLARKIGEELGIDDDELRTLHQAALLHDIGKLGIPDRILNKPGRLTDAEFAIIKEHPERGEQILQRVESLVDCIPGIRHHHERLDGSGYPDRLRGDAIPLMARVIAVADMYDAMTSARPYRAPLTPQAALQIIAGEATTRLDRDCVDALLRVIGVDTAAQNDVRDLAGVAD